MRRMRTLHMRSLLATSLVVLVLQNVADATDTMDVYARGWGQNSIDLSSGSMSDEYDIVAQVNYHRETTDPSHYPAQVYLKVRNTGQNWFLAEWHEDIIPWGNGYWRQGLNAGSEVRVHIGTLEVGEFDYGWANNWLGTIDIWDDIVGDGNLHPKSWEIQIDLEMNGFSGGSFSGAVDFGNGTKWSDWFGWYNDQKLPWLWDYEYNDWLWVVDDDPDGVWFWSHSQQTWFWTRTDWYPWVYFTGDAGLTWRGN